MYTYPKHLVLLFYQNENALNSINSRLGLEWKLLYMGEGLEYEVQGLIPRHALLSEPGLTVQVKFCLRTTGVDYPDGEFSDASKIVEYSTVWVNLEDEEDPYAALEAEDSGASYTASSNRMSKTKREVITAVLSGQRTVQLERWKDTIGGEGTFDSFL
jgi:hypothetical protein